MKGYIALTKDTWWDYIYENSLSTAVFWKKRTTFKALVKNDRFYFLYRASQAPDRNIVGWADFDCFKVLKPAEAWAQFGEMLGCSSQKTFFDNVYSIYGKEAIDSIGCIVLKKIHFCKSPHSLRKLGIEFSPYTVSGKIITDEECRKVEKND